MTFRVLAAAVAGAVVIFVLGYAIWGAFFASLMTEGVIQHPGLTKETPNFAVLFSSNLVLAFLLAFIFEYWSKSRSFVVFRGSAEGRQNPRNQKWNAAFSFIPEVALTAFRSCLW